LKEVRVGRKSEGILSPLVAAHACTNSRKISSHVTFLSASVSLIVLHEGRDVRVRGAYFPCKVVQWGSALAEVWEPQPAQITASRNLGSRENEELVQQITPLNIKSPLLQQARQAAVWVPEMAWEGKISECAPGGGRGQSARGTYRSGKSR